MKHESGIDVLFGRRQRRGRPIAGLDRKPPASAAEVLEITSAGELNELLAGAKISRSALDTGAP